MQITTVAQVTINADVESVFDCSIDCHNLPKFFTGYKLIPAIVNASTLDNMPVCTGSRRIVSNSDGSVVEELIVRLQRPEIQEYRLLNGLKPPFSWLVCSACGQWLYETLDSTPNSVTKITWVFKFEMRNFPAYLLFLFTVNDAFQKAQEICLENLKRYVETTQRE